MKIYTNEIDLARPILKKFYTAPCSDYKFGVKIVQGMNYVIELNGVKLKSDGETGGYATYKMTSPNEQGVELFKIICENGQIAYIKHVTTDSTVFDVDEGGSVEIPTKTSELVNDSDFATNASVDEKIGGVTSSIPTKTSQLQNDSGFITVEVVPTKTSQLVNDSEFADKNFVNSSIATNTANFKGTYESSEGWPTDATNNDYLFWKTVDENGNTIYKRYKYIASTSTWTYEYTLNNSSFTAEQWATINNGPYASTTDIPTKTSELENDSGFITVEGVPTKTSELVNDSDFATNASVDEKIGGVTSSIPTKTSQLDNDSNFTTKTELDTVNQNLTTSVLNM